VGALQLSVEDDIAFIAAAFWHECEKRGRGLLACTVVVTASPVGLLGRDVFLDLDAVEEPVLAGNLASFDRVGLDHTSPGKHDIEVSLQIGKFSAAGDSIWQHPDDVSHIFDTLNQVKVLDIVKCLLGIVDENLSVLHAALKFASMVVASEAVNETRSEVGNCDHGWQVGLVDLNWANSEGEQVSQVSASLEH